MILLNMPLKVRLNRLTYITSKKMSWVNIIIMNEPYLDQLQIKGSFLI